MANLYTFLFVVQVLVSICLIGFILIQHGKGADAGAAFGSGASSTVFGSHGSGNFLTRGTTVLAIIFLGNSLLLGYLAGESTRQQTSVMESEEIAVVEKQAVQEPAGTEPPAGPVSDVPTLPEK